LPRPAPIGIFDSGIGGLSVLRHVQALLPQQDLLYFADAGFAPYGEKPEAVIVARARAIAAFLRERGASALVVACNTATVAAIRVLREHYPALPLVGVEPGLKPAAVLSKSRIVGVLATDRTLAGEKFAQLHAHISAATEVRFLLQACTGLATQIERGDLRSATTRALLQTYITPLIEQGADTLVLGCTHYPFVLPMIEDIITNISPHPIMIVDTGEAVARQLVRQLTQHQLLPTQRTTPLSTSLPTVPPGQSPQPSLTGFTSGSKSALESAFAALLGLYPVVAEVGALGNFG
jgi:glutamate racemase